MIIFIVSYTTFCISVFHRTGCSRKVSYMCPCIWPCFIQYGPCGGGRDTTTRGRGPDLPTWRDKPLPGKGLWDSTEPQSKLHLASLGVNQVVWALILSLPINIGKISWNEAMGPIGYIFAREISLNPDMNLVTWNYCYTVRSSSYLSLKMTADHYLQFVFNETHLLWRGACRTS